MDENVDNVIIVDNIPVTDSSKLTKLGTVTYTYWCYNFQGYLLPTIWQWILVIKMGVIDKVSRTQLEMLTISSTGNVLLKTFSKAGRIDNHHIPLDANDKTKG